MFSIKSLFKAVQSWRRNRGGPRAVKRSDIALERLDHRQLMAVNFTGNAITDIPATGTTGTVILGDNGTVRHPVIPSDLQDLIKVSGLDVNGIRLAYTPDDDILSIALQQPDNQKTGQLVLAGDTDNNGNGATVASGVIALRPAFLDFGFLGGSESMGAFLDLDNDGIPDVVAGISNDPSVGKLYQVNDAIVNPDPVIAANTVPRFGSQLLNNTGASFLTNDPARPSFEFQVTNFSQLYLQETGQALQTDSVIRVGGFGVSIDDDGISEAFFPSQAANFGVVPPPPPVCPPPPIPSPPAVVLRPPVFVNPHAGHHVNTAHPTDVRVSVLGSANFDPNLIIPASVRLGGAAPISTFPRDINHDNIPDRTFIFRGSDINLPPGKTRAIVTGALTDGTFFRSGEPIFNRNDSFYTDAQIAARDARQTRQGFDATNPPLTPSQKHALALASLHDKALEGAMDAEVSAFASASRPKVKIATRAGSATSVSVDSTTEDSMTMTMSSESSPAASQSSSAAFLEATAKRNPVAQPASPVVVSIPRKNSVVVSEATITAPKAKARLTAGMNRAGLARAAKARA